MLTRVSTVAVNLTMISVAVSAKAGCLTSSSDITPGCKEDLVSFVWLRPEERMLPQPKHDSSVSLRTSVSTLAAIAGLTS